MKKESVRKQEARDQVKKRAAQVAATMGVAGTGTAFAATAFAGGDESTAEEDVVEVPDVKVEENTTTNQKPTQQHSQVHQPQPQSSHQQAPAATVLEPEQITAEEPMSETAVVEETVIAEEAEVEIEPAAVVEPEMQEPAATPFTAMNAVNSGVYEASSITIDEDGEFLDDSDMADFADDGLIDPSLNYSDCADTSISFDDMMSVGDGIEPENFENSLDIEF